MARHAEGIAPRPLTRLLRFTQALDTALLAVTRRTQYAVLLLTAMSILAFSLPRVPRQHVDFSGLPVLHRLAQPATYGPDTISDMYEARVVLNDPADMYTKAKVEMTPLEAATWTKEATAPYPPAMLLASAGLYALGDGIGIGLYGVTLILAGLFLLSSALYFLQTRWYLFPLLHLNFWFFGNRFAYVQDGSYLVMLTLVMTALWMARWRKPVAHVLMAMAIALKLLPLYYVRHVARMAPVVAALVIAVVVAGLVLPYFIWENYLYIYAFADERTGNDWRDISGALALVIPLTIVQWYVEARLGFDDEDRVGWSLVPFALLSGILANSGRHMLIALIVPDKRGARNVAAAVGLALHTLLPGIVRLGSVVYVTAGVLAIALACYLSRVGWSIVRDDLAHPLRTAKLMLRG